MGTVISLQAGVRGSDRGGPQKDAERMVLAAVAASGGLVPADERLLALLLSDPPDSHELRAAIGRLVASGRVRQVVVGAEPHLALGSERPARRDRPAVEEHDDAHAQTKAQSGSAKQVPQAEARSEDADKAFQREISIDVAQERAVLWRVIIVFEVLVLLLIVRSALLSWMGM